jgi:hypothetical protein
MLKTEAEMPAPHTDPQLQATEDAALSWIEEQGQDQMEQDEILQDFTKEQAGASALASPAPSKEQVAGASLNQKTVRVPLGWGPNATDGEGTVLPTTYQVPAVLAREAGKVAADALAGPDFTNVEVLPMEQVELPLDVEEK